MPVDEIAQDHDPRHPCPAARNHDRQPGRTTWNHDPGHPVPTGVVPARRLARDPLRKHRRARVVMAPGSPS
jgi:hypothetical protein